MDTRSEVHNRSKEIVINEWLSETTDTVMKYVVVEKIDGTPSRTQLCATIEEASQLQRQWQL
jgi:hypothetical protein